MALQAEVKTSYGVLATYFKIVGSNFNFLLGKSTLVLSGYCDKIARENGDKPLMTKEYKVEGIEFAQYFSTSVLSAINPVESGYNYIKATDEKFINAVSV